MQAPGLLRWWRYRVVVLVLTGVGGLVWLFSGSQTEPIDSYQACAEAGYPIAESDPPVCRTSRQSFVGPRSAPMLASEPASVQPFDVLVQGDSGGDYPKRQIAIRTPLQWTQYWKEIHVGLPSLPPLIPVDFTAHDVLLLSDGRQETTGYSLKVIRVASRKSGTLVQATQSVPTIACPVAPRPSNRYVMVRTPKLTEPISFEVTRTMRRC